MADIKQTMFDIERCICHVPDACRDCSHYGFDRMECMESLLKNALELLKKQHEIIEKYHKADSFLEAHGWKWERQAEQHDCRDCYQWLMCPNGMIGHINGTSIGFSSGECKDFRPVT